MLLKIGVTGLRTLSQFVAEGLLDVGGFGIELEDAVSLRLLLAPRVGIYTEHPTPSMTGRQVAHCVVRSRSAHGTFFELGSHCAMREDGRVVGRFALKTAHSA
jgi:hypothetical protein